MAFAPPLPDEIEESGFVPPAPDEIEKLNLSDAEKEERRKRITQEVELKSGIGMPSILPSGNATALERLEASANRIPLLNKLPSAIEWVGRALAETPRSLVNAPAAIVNTAGEAAGLNPNIRYFEHGEPLFPELLPEQNTAAQLLSFGLPGGEKRLVEAIAKNKAAAVPPLAGYAAGLAKAVEDLARGLTTPEVLMTLPAGGGSGLASRAVPTVFGLQMIKDTPEAYGEFGRTTAEGSPADVARAGLGALGSSAMILHMSEPGITSGRKPPGGDNASEIPGATRLPKPEVRPPVGEATSLRQPGEAAPARGIETPQPKFEPPKPEEVDNNPLPPHIEDALREAEKRADAGDIEDALRVAKDFGLGKLTEYGSESLSPENEAKIGDWYDQVNERIAKIESKRKGKEFGPDMDTMRRVAEMPPEEFSKNARAFNKWNIEVGLTAKPEDIAELKKFHADANAKMLEARNAALANPTEENLNRMQDLSALPQFFNEAIQLGDMMHATGLKYDGTARGHYQFTDPVTKSSFIVKEGTQAPDIVKKMEAMRAKFAEAEKHPETVDEKIEAQIARMAPAASPTYEHGLQRTIDELTAPKPKLSEDAEPSLAKLYQASKDKFEKVKAKIMAIFPGVEVKLAPPDVDIKIAADGKTLEASPELLDDIERQFPGRTDEVLGIMVEEEQIHHEQISKLGQDFKSRLSEIWNSADKTVKQLVRDVYSSWQTKTEDELGAELLRMAAQATRKGRITESILDARADGRRKDQGAAAKRSVASLVKWANENPDLADLIGTATHKAESKPLATVGDAIGSKLDELSKLVTQLKAEGPESAPAPARGTKPPESGTETPPSETIQTQNETLSAEDSGRSKATPEILPASKPGTSAAGELPPAGRQASPQHANRVYDLENADLLESQRNLDAAIENGDKAAESIHRQERDDSIQRLAQFDKLKGGSEYVGAEDSDATATAKAIRQNPQMTYGEAVIEGLRMKRQAAEDEAYDAPENARLQRERDARSRLTPPAANKSARPGDVSEATRTEQPAAAVAKVQEHVAKVAKREKVPAPNVEPAGRTDATQLMRELQIPVDKKFTKKIEAKHKELKSLFLDELKQVPQAAILERLVRSGDVEQKGKAFRAKTMAGAAGISALEEHRFKSTLDAGMRAIQEKAVAEDRARLEATLSKSKPTQAPTKAIAKVEEHVTEVAKREKVPTPEPAIEATTGPRAAKEIKSELVQRLEQELTKAPATADYNYREARTTTIEIPGDGSFTVPYHKGALQEIIDRAKRINTSDNTPPKKVPSKTDPYANGGVIDAYGGDADAVYKMARRQISTLTAPEDAVSRKQAEEFAAELYKQTTAAKLEAKAEQADKLAQSYRDGAESFRKSIAKIQALKKPSKARLAELADLQRRYQENQTKLGEFKKSAETFSQQAAKAKAALEEVTQPPYRGTSAAGDQLMPPESDINAGNLGNEGMGGAKPTEFDRPGTFVSNMFAEIDRDRASLGKGPMEAGEPRTWDQDNQRALAEMNRNPNWIPELLDEVTRHPRPLMSWEQAGTVWQRAKWRAELNNAYRRINSAFEDGRNEDLVAAKIDAAHFEALMEKMDRAVGRGGTGSEAGRTLRAQRMAAGDDFNLVEAILRLQASKGGVPLTDAERLELTKRIDELQAANNELQTHVADRDERIARAEMEAATERLKREALEKKPSVPEVIIKKAEELVRKLDTSADAARQRLREKSIRFNTGLDPTVLADLAVIGASHIGHVGLDFAKWSVKMASEFGDGIKPHLNDIFEKSKTLIDEIGKDKAVVDEVKKEKLNPIDSAKKAIEEKVADDELDGIGPYVQRIAKEYVRMGVRETEALIDAVRGELLDIVPDISRREVMDLISGYGDFKNLSREEIAVALRGMKGEMQQLAKLEDMANGVPPLKSGLERRTPTDKERELIKAVNEAKLKFQVPMTDPIRQLKSALDTRKTALQNRITDLENRLAKKDFTKKPRRELVLDRRALELQAKVERLKKAVRAKEIEAERAARSKTEKAFDFVSNVRRFAVLSGAKVLAKLAAYSATKLPTMAATEAVGALYSKLPYLNRIAEKAPSEGGFNLTAIAESTARAFTKGMEDAWKTLRTGSGDLKAAFSKYPETERHWYDIPQSLHEVIKSPLRRAAFELSLSKRMAHAAKNGVDITDPLVQLALAKDAYLDSDRALLLEQNRLASGIRGLFRTAEQKSKATGKPRLSGKALATLGRVEFPILTVPLNYAKQTLVAAFGLISGSSKAMRAYSRGIENLKPEEADAILRHLKYGTIGGAMLLWGFFDGYNNGSGGTFGGYYQPGQKRKEDEAEAGGMKVGDQKVSGFLLHNPVIAAAQFGHTIGAIAQSKLKKNDPEERGIGSGTIAASMGLINESPLGRQVELLYELGDPQKSDYAFGRHVKGIAVPQLSQEASEFLDKDAYGRTVKRNPRTVLEHIKTGIPLLRQQVPEKLRKR